MLGDNSPWGGSSFRRSLLAAAGPLLRPPSRTVTGPTQTVTTTATATTTASAPTSPDASAFLEKSLTDKVPGGTGQSTQSLLKNSHPGAIIDVTGAKGVEAGTTEHYRERSAAAADRRGFRYLPV